MSILTEDHRRTEIGHPDEIYQGLDARLFSLAGRLARSPGRIGGYLAQASEIEKLAPAWASLPEGALRSRLQDMKEHFRRRAQGYRDLMPQAVAALREAAARHVGLRPYPVQIAGALALTDGYLVEMATGEGKTLTASIAAALRGWEGLPCHIITVNDYLAGRDSRWMAPLYRACGLTVGCVTADQDQEGRRQGYNAEIVYTTNKEIVADFLRDRLWLGGLQDSERRRIAALLGSGGRIERGLVMRGIHFAVVDEADSILIDEAVTPLIISHSLPNDLFLEACRVASRISRSFALGADYSLDERYKEIELSPQLAARLGPLVEQSGARYRGINGYLDLVQQALSAREFFHRDSQYVVQDGKVVIVDEFTGRRMPQRTWRFGLHQLIEAKENVEMTPPSETLARLSFQRFYRFFRVLAGMTGTAREAAEEFWAIYRLATISVPENRPCLRRILPLSAFARQEAKWKAMVDEILALHRAGRPVLVGTRTVRDSEMLSRRLADAGLSHRVLNAVRHKEEAGVISRAGVQGAVTVATNMAGRGTDITLGEGVASRGGLHVIAAEPSESGRVDRQLYGRSARQGDPGTARLYVSMEDEIVQRFVPGPARALAGALLRKETAGRAAASAAVFLAQARSQRLARMRRRSVLRTDTWLEDSLSFAHRDIS